MLAVCTEVTTATGAPLRLGFADTLFTALLHVFALLVNAVDVVASFAMVASLTCALLLHTLPAQPVKQGWGYHPSGALSSECLLS